MKAIKSKYQKWLKVRLRREVIEKHHKDGFQINLSIKIFWQKYAFLPDLNKNSSITL
jgi:hypothetical protein